MHGVAGGARNVPALVLTSLPQHALAVVVTLQSGAGLDLRLGL
jgi:hypothetical protein